MGENTYQGHGAATGGLQQHSVGDIYPLAVFGQEQPQGFTAYGVIDLAIGEVLAPAVYTCADAHAEARLILQRWRAYL